MCWFTLTPAKGKKQHHHDRHSTDSSCVEELVRVRRDPSPRFTPLRVKVPGGVSMEFEDHHHLHPHSHLHPHLNHHHNHHLHPLHLHPLHPIHGHHHHHHHHHGLPVRLRGPGRKRCPPPSPPPPSRAPSKCRPAPRSRSCSPARPREPIYHTQIVEPAQVRESTRVALCNPERPRGRLRRVAGYELLGREVPWQWDCVSSTVGSSVSGGKWSTKKRSSKGGGGLRYPPFGSMDRWL
ncbi:hypothetical protein IQ07DRAFT_233575 [Pyrenochaeta sp. DS3sAY3a]|nr:hypothetical protein IQ07DRAFT_233575 [Pyrenochaeta sp. DS3sAY3a]